MPRRSSMASPCHVPPTASRTVPFGRTGAWLKTPTRALRPRRTTPPSGSCSPLMMRNSVLLPQPFRPTTPTRSPSLRVIETSAKSGRFGREALSPWASITITTAQATSTSPPNSGRDTTTEDFSPTVRGRTPPHKPQTLSYAESTSIRRSL